jgi:uncharacterized protein
MARSEETFTVEIVYASGSEQVLLTLKVEPGATVKDAIERSGIMRRFPHVDHACATVGIFGSPVRPDSVLREGDRVEIYRPLIADPKDARRKRVKRSG